MKIIRIPTWELGGFKEGVSLMGLRNDITFSIIFAIRRYVKDNEYS